MERFSYIVLRLTYIQGSILELSRSFPIEKKVYHSGCVHRMHRTVIHFFVVIAVTVLYSKFQKALPYISIGWKHPKVVCLFVKVLRKWWLIHSLNPAPLQWLLLMASISHHCRLYITPTESTKKRERMHEDQCCPAVTKYDAYRAAQIFNQATTPFCSSINRIRPVQISQCSPAATKIQSKITPLPVCRDILPGRHPFSVTL